MSKAGREDNSLTATYQKILNGWKPQPISGLQVPKQSNSPQ